MQVPTLTELASGVDALYLSGRALLGSALLDRLSAARADAEKIEGLVPFDFGGIEFSMQPFNFGKYRYRLESHLGFLGITDSKNLPTFRVQPRAEFIHGAGPRGVVEFYRQLIEAECGIVLFSVSRADLFADFQGWDLTGDDRRDFLCRAKSRTIHEENDAFNGLQFGRRTSGTVYARLYNKTIETEKKGSGYWKDIWGEKFDPERPVIRVEFELAGKVLREYGIRTPEEFLDAVGALWVSLTCEWLTHRTPTEDQTRSRWPNSPEWLDVQRASIAQTDWGITRMYDGQRLGTLENLMPGLVGYVVNFASLTNCASLHEALTRLETHVNNYTFMSRVPFDDRVRQRRQRNGLP